MATAKQIAARKEFARIMKSGGFGPRKAKAKPRKKNPLARSRSGTPYESTMRSIPFRSQRVLSKAPKAKRNPSGRNSRDAYGNAWDADNARANNPKKRVAVKRNPTRSPVGYKVCKATAQGLQGALIAAFVSKADAVQYGKAYVKANKRAVVIVGKSH